MRLLGVQHAYCVVRDVLDEQQYLVVGERLLVVDVLVDVTAVRPCVSAT